MLNTKCSQTSRNKQIQFSQYWNLNGVYSNELLIKKMFSTVSGHSKNMEQETGIRAAGQGNRASGHEAISKAASEQRCE